MKNFTHKVFGILVAVLFTIAGIYALTGVELIPLNDVFNKIAGEPDKSCNTDSDCTMKKIDCSVCSYYSQGDAVNKNWAPFCPLRTLGQFCPMALPAWGNAPTLCESNKCRQITSEDFQKIMDDNEKKILEDLTETLGVEIKSLRNNFSMLMCHKNGCSIYGTLQGCPVSIELEVKKPRDIINKGAYALSIQFDDNECPQPKCKNLICKYRT